MPEHKKRIGSTVFQVILNSGGGFAERICYLELFVVKVYCSILGYRMKIEAFWPSRAQWILEHKFLDILQL